MNLEHIMTTYGVTRLAALTRLANAKAFAYNGQYDPIAVRRIFEPAPRVTTDAEDKEALYAFVRDEVRF